MAGGDFPAWAVKKFFKKNIDWKERRANNDKR